MFYHKSVSVPINKETYNIESPDISHLFTPTQQVKFYKRKSCNNHVKSSRIQKETKFFQE